MSKVVIVTGASRSTGIIHRTGEKALCAMHCAKLERLLFQTQI
ncbi:hypothetical protein [Alteromonas gracilis]